jgi:hypothetical protein
MFGKEKVKTRVGINKNSSELFLGIGILKEKEL